MDQALLKSLEDTLKQITAPSTAGIKAASEKLQSEFYTKPETVVGLVQLLQHHEAPEIRQLAGVEARKLVTKLWEQLDMSVSTQIKNSLLLSTLAEQNALVRHTSSRVISVIAKIDIDEDRWDELLPFLYTTCKSPNAADREVAVYILYTMLDADLVRLMDSSVELLHLFATTINDPKSLNVRVSTVLGLGKVSENIDTVAVAVAPPADPSQNPIELFRALIPPMVEVLKQVIEAGDGKSALQVFEVFNTLLLVDSQLVAKHLGDLITFILSEFASQPSVENEYRLPALTFLLTAARFKKNRIQALKLGPLLTNTALQIASEGSGEDDEDDDDDTPGRLALRLIDILSSSLPPNQVAGPLVALLPEYVKSANANQRRAAFLALSASAEGAPDFYAAQIDTVLPLVIAGMSDPVQLVKISALRALSHLASELRDVVTEEHETLVPLVFQIMGEATSLKVGKSACLALDAILESIDRKIITEKYLSELVPKLLQLLNSAQDFTLKGSIVAAIASAAFSAGKNFQPYFEHTIHALEPFVRIAGATGEEITEEHNTLCGITLDALGALAGAVGKDTFRPYVQPLVEAAYRCIQSNQSRLKECGFIFIGVLARVYGTEFSPFLDTIVPDLFKCLKQDDYTSGEDDEDEEEAVGIDEDDDPLAKLSVNSAMAIEKEIAIETLGDIIASTKTDFTKYLETATELLMLCSEHFYEGIRKNALTVLWKAYTVFYEASIADGFKWQPGFPASYSIPDAVVHLGKLARDITLQIMSTETERSVATAMCDCIAEAIRLTGPIALGTADDLQTICGEALLILGKLHTCQTMEDEDELDGTKPNEEEQDDGENAEYDYVLTDSAMDVFIQLASALGPQFGPVFQSCQEAIAKYCVSKSATERASGIGAFAEMVNGMRAEVTPWTNQLSELFLQALGDSDLEVRSNAAYGIGLVCYYSEDSELAGKYFAILQKLQRLLKKVDKKQRRSRGLGDEEDNNSARSLANACGCVARMMLNNQASVPLGEVLPVLLSRLPLHDAYEENTPIFELIVKLFQEQNPTIVELRTQIVDIFEQVFVQELEMEQDEATRSDNAADEVKPFENDEIKAKVVELLKYLEQQQTGLVSCKPVLARIA